MDDTQIYIEKVIDTLDIKKDDTLVLSGNFIQVIMKIREIDNSLCMESIIDIFIDAVVKKIGIEGTLLIHTFNWDFSSGKAYDINNTKPKTGVLGTQALKRKDFVRTKHPIYSFAVIGKHKDYLVSLDNKSGFGCTSPFAFLHKEKGSMIVFDMTLQDSFTFVHYVEEVNNISYRYNKSFRADYVDIDGIVTSKEYDLFVRDLEKNVTTYLAPLEDLFIDSCAMNTYELDGIKLRKVNLDKAYDIVEDDILNNNAKSIHRQGD